MAQNILLNSQDAKHYKSEFIFKLIDIMKNYPQLVYWTLDGYAIQLSQVTQIQNTVLPSYFRHSNFQSFLRQLHLYNFRQNKTKKNQLIFEHSIFKKGSEDQFHLIKRTKHKKQKQSLLKELQNNDILKRISENSTLNQNQKNVLNTLTSFKLIVLEKQKLLKLKLNELANSLKSNRSKTTKQTLLVLEEEIKLQMDSNKKFSKSIDIFLTQTLNQRTQEYSQKSPTIVHDNQKQQRKRSQKDKKSQNKSHNESVHQKSHNESVHQYKKTSLFPCLNGLQNNSQAFCQKDSFYAYHKVFSQPSNQILIKQSVPEKYYREKTEYRQAISQQFDQKRMFMRQAPQGQDFMACRNNQSIPMGFFNFQREPSLIFMPLPVYNRSVMSEFFDRPNQKTYTDFINNDKPEDKKQKQKLPQYKSKSQEFQTTGKHPKGSGYNEENIANTNEDSEISFMNEECVK